MWFATPETSSSNSIIYDINIGNSEILVTGEFYSELELANVSKNAGGNPNGFLANLNLQGEWQWFREIDSSGTVSIRSLSTDLVETYSLAASNIAAWFRMAMVFRLQVVAEQWMLL